ncbi:PSD1 and planctomycete cytochrome C domain-containing protein [Schlesneria sp. T3-172]|uniref:PSD1 and planctomycete cytochrome C domain-containing protein n=1 Tax=Schlesneria sphaerica TaxID=3373610 RepID=UPI0037CC6DA4
MGRRTTLQPILSCIILFSFVTSGWGADAAPPGDLRSQTIQLIKSRCVKCHGPAQQEGGLSLALPSGIARGGHSGIAVIAGNPAESLLWQRVETDAMPPDEPLTQEEKELLRHWIAQGASGLPESVSPVADGDEHWAFQKLVPKEVPPVIDAPRVLTPVDAFLLKELEKAGLTLNTEADRRRLIRRVSLDLTGVPPTRDEIRLFLNDPHEHAYEQMVERFLASARYGERWGKHWLDAAGYADSNGYFGADTDRPLAFRYRDYVIRSINADKPFDRFIIEQLAGDELARIDRPGFDGSPETIELLEATHFLRNSPDGTDSSDGNEDEVRADRYAVLEGELQIIGSALLGITVQCARCHDHKFEPLRQKDYYQLQAVLFPVFNVDKWVTPNARQVTVGSPEQIAAYETTIQKINDEIAAAREKYREWIRANREAGKPVFRDDFDGADRKLADTWANSAPGDAAPAGQPAVNIDSTDAPAARASDGRLQIIESGGSGDRACSTRQIFDWTPDQEGNWIRVTFDLVTGADYVGFLIALRDFNDAEDTVAGNILLDGAASGGVTVHVDYPGTGSRGVGSISQQKCLPGHNYGVQVTNMGGGKYQLAHIFDGAVETQSITLTEKDLPDGGFGFEYCCGRSFTVDNVLIETGETTPDALAFREELAKRVAKKRAEHEAEIRQIEARRPRHPGIIAAAMDLSAEAPEVYLLERGVYKNRSEKVDARAPEVLAEETNPSTLLGRTPEVTGSTGSRLALARWLTQPDSRAASLLARVTANRWWQHHFGTGLAPTPENLGYSGVAPTHPELLEYLASELIRSGWSAKSFHRLILHSAAYRQSSVPHERGENIDPSNQLLWRFPLNRMDAESIRDSMLAIAGELDLRHGGPYVPTAHDAEGDVVVKEATDGALRRSIYLQQRRTQVPGILEVFDSPSIVANCTLRIPTTIPLQSLKLLNSEFVRSRSAAFAKRVLSDVEGPLTRRIDYAFELAVGRPATSDESAFAIDFLERQPAEYPGQADAEERAWVDFTNLLLSINAFLYIE